MGKGGSAILTRSATGRSVRKLTLAVLACAMVAASGCGRRGDPEAPSAAAVLSTDENGNTVKNQKPAAPDRPFILDPLLR